MFFHSFWDLTEFRAMGRTGGQLVPEVKPCHTQPLLGYLLWQNLGTVLGSEKKYNQAHSSHI